MDPVLGFTETSKNARQVSFVYDKLRRAELRRNVWRHAIRRAVMRAINSDTMLLAASMWVETTTYFVGSVVSDDNNVLWISVVPNNLGNTPANSTTWGRYFGPLTVSLYDDTTTYFAGELVYTAPGDGTNRVYLSLQSANSDTPSTATDWDATAVYLKNQVVTYSSVAYMSLIDLNTNQTPSASAANWDAGTVYALNDLVNGSDGVTYRSLVGANTGNDPTTDIVNWVSTGALTAWTTVFTGGAGSLKWLLIGGAEFPYGVGLSELNIIYPLGSGPSTQVTTRNAYRLPAGFLRKAPQDPKAGSNSYLGAPSNLEYNDWNLEGNYIVSSQVEPIILRFIADVTDVKQFDDMFCEGLGARIALETCEVLTQSTQKVSNIASQYQKFMGEARTINAIETGSEEPPLDDYIACRG